MPDDYAPGKAVGHGDFRDIVCQQELRRPPNSGAKHGGASADGKFRLPKTLHPAGGIILGNKMDWNFLRTTASPLDWAAPPADERFQLIIGQYLSDPTGIVLTEIRPASPCAVVDWLSAVTH